MKHRSILFQSSTVLFEEEAPGILKWAVQGAQKLLVELRESGGFNSQTSNEHGRPAGRIRQPQSLPEGKGETGGGGEFDDGGNYRRLCRVLPQPQLVSLHPSRK